MALSHLLETSVITRLQDPDIQNAITELKSEGAGIGRASISDLELGYSARNAGEWDEVLTDLEAFELVENDRGACPPGQGSPAAARRQAPARSQGA